MFKDKAESIKMLDNPVKKIHGHTKIELTDVKTGEKKVIEHDNVFQAGVLAQVFRSMGTFNNSPYDNDTWNSQAIWRNLVGGIFLFRDTIDNSNDEVEYMPSGNQMTANGSYGVTNTGNPVELGSWNSVESSIGTNSIIMVYDWDTSHGNGTIGSICLTSETGGYIGYGNPSGAVASNRNLFVNQNSRQVQGIICGNYRYRPASDGIYRSKITVSKGSVFEGIETLIPHTWGENMQNYAFDFTNGKIVSYYQNYYMIVGPGSTFTLDVFDCATETFTTVTCTNGSTENINGRQATAGNGYFIYGTRFDAFEGGHPYHVFDYTTGSYVDDLPTDSDGRIQYGLIAPDLEFCGTHSQNIQIKTDAEDDESWLFTNGRVNTNDYQEIGYNAEHDCLFHSVGSAKNTKAYKNPLYLATINNLETAVVKNNTQTMKVTYTLTEVST